MGCVASAPSKARLCLSGESPDTGESAKSLGRVLKPKAKAEWKQG